MSDEIERIIRRDLDRLPGLPEDRWVPAAPAARSSARALTQSIAAVAVVVVALALGTALAQVRADPAASATAAPFGVPAASGCSDAGLTLARAYGPDAQLVAVFDSTIADVASAYQVHPAASAAPLEPVGVCFYDGHFAVMKGPPGASGVPTYGRIEVLIWPGNDAALLTAGDATGLPLIGPATGPNGARPTAPSAATVPMCPQGLTAVLAISFPPPPGDSPGTGSASPEAAFRRAFPTLTSFTLTYPFGTGDRAPAWIVAGDRTFVAEYHGAPGANSWFAYPAVFTGCRSP